MILITSFRTSFLYLIKFIYLKISCSVYCKDSFPEGRRPPKTGVMTKNVRYATIRHRMDG